MDKYLFSVQTRDGQRVDGLSIMAASREAAETRLRMMYRECVVLSCTVQPVDAPRTASASVEDLITRISKES